MCTAEIMKHFQIHSPYCNAYHFHAHAVIIPSFAKQRIKHNKKKNNVYCIDYEAKFLLDF